MEIENIVANTVLLKAREGKDVIKEKLIYIYIYVYPPPLRRHHPSNMAMDELELWAALLGIYPFSVLYPFAALCLRANIQHII